MRNSERTDENILNDSEGSVMETVAVEGGERDVEIFGNKSGTHVLSLDDETVMDESAQRIPSVNKCNVYPSVEADVRCGDEALRAGSNRHHTPVQSNTEDAEFMETVETLCSSCLMSQATSVQLYRSRCSTDDWHMLMAKI